MLNWLKSKKSWLSLRFPIQLEQQHFGKNATGRLWPIVLCGVAAILIETSLLHAWSPVPDLLLILCVYMGVYHASVSGAGCSFILGYVLDTAAGAPVGIHTLVNTLVFSVSAMLSKSLWTNNVTSVLAMVVCGVLLKAATGMFLYEPDLAAGVVLRLFRQHTVWDLILSLCLTPIVFSSLILVESRLAKRGELPNG